MRRLILILVVALAVVTGGYAYLAGQDKPEERLSVLFAVKNVSPGKFIPSESVEVRQVPLSEFRSLEKKFGALANQDALKSLQTCVPRHAISKGDAISENNLIHPTDPDFLPAVLTEGHRAVSIRFNPVTSGIGLFRPGNYVDVILTYADRRATKTENKLAMTLFRGLRILALGGDMGFANTKESSPKNSAENSSVVTLEATPRQAETLVLASSLGQLSLSLRANGSQSEDLEQTQTSMRDLIQIQSENRSPARGAYSGDRNERGPVQVRGLFGDQQKIFKLE